MRHTLRLALVVLVAGTVAGSVVAEDIMIPAFAWHLHGVGHNRWTSEVYVTNPTEQQATIAVGVPIVGRQTLLHPCEPPSLTYTVPPLATTMVSARALATALGCPDDFVGALVLQPEGDLIVNSRMTNEMGAEGLLESGLLFGYGQEIPGVSWSDLPHEGFTYMLPALVAHPNACGGRLYESALHFANPGSLPVEVKILAPADLVIDDVLTAAPSSFQVAPMSWIQVRVRIPDAPLAVCADPEMFDVLFQVSDVVGVVGSVVDRTTQDPRTVMPVLVK